jgi:biopolymer transport protein ExbD
MAMGKTPGDPEGNGEDVGFAEINITPLTDIFLVLLIIFMVTSSVIVQQAPGGAQTGLKVNLPKGGTTDVTARATDLSVAVLADGRFVLGGNVVSEDELKRAFAKAQQDNPDTVVIVQADEGVPHGTVVLVMEMAKSVGLGQLAIGVRDSR